MNAVFLIYEHDQGQTRVIKVIADQDYAYSQLLSLTDFPSTPTAEYTIEQKEIERPL
jgi:hypothetical protein